MPYASFPIAISDVVDLLGLERNPRDPAGAVSFNVKCPFCGDGKKYKMNINTAKNVYFCPRCMDSSTGNAGALDLYGRVRFGTPLRPKENGKELYYKLCTELEGNSIYTKKETCQRPLPEEIEPAPDELLDRAYRALLSLPYLTLTKRHGRNLLNRGLNEDAARQGGYASLRAADLIVKDHERSSNASSWYDRKGIEKIRKDNAILQNYSREELLAGLLIARDLIAQGIKLERVPGFFKLAGCWCFRYDQGMAIPTINLNGCIVGLQIRRDTATKAGLRYMTVSSKGLIGGVTTRIARTHVARTGDINKDTVVYLTEGPLKANVILHLLQERNEQNIAVIAIQGVNNTKELPEIVDTLRGIGIDHAISALDMDKCGNMSVARAGRTIKRIFEDRGIHMTTLCWDKEYAEQKVNTLSALCVEHNISFTLTDNVFDNVYLLSSKLSEQSIPYDYEIINGKKYKTHWREECKGLDDQLLMEREKLQKSS